MTRRPLPIQPATDREINASWLAIKDRMEAPRPQWRMAWIFASVIAFISVSAGATVLITQAVKRQAAIAEAKREEEARAESQRRSLHRQPAPAPAVAPEPVAEVAEEVAPAPPKPTAAPPKKTPRHLHVGAGEAPKVEEDKPLIKPDEAPADVFVLGSQARARGDFNRALGYYEKFVEEHPADARAALAAMEACRILADNLENTKGALIWADRTIALAQRGPLREDARARKVQLLGITGQTARCVEAKSKFISDYPESVHTDRVNRACP